MKNLIRVNKDPFHLHTVFFFRWRPVVWGLVLQFTFGLLILRWDVGVQIFECIGQKAVTFLGVVSKITFFGKLKLHYFISTLGYTDQGSGLVYGYLVTQTPFGLENLDNTSIAYDVAKEFNDKKVVRGVFMFQVLSAIFFFSFITSMAFYMGWMQW